MLKEENPLQGTDLIGLIQILLGEVGIRNLPEMAKIYPHQKGRQVTLNLTSGIKTLPAKRRKQVSTPVEIV